MFTAQLGAKAKPPPGRAKRFHVLLAVLSLYWLISDEIPDRKRAH